MNQACLLNTRPAHQAKDLSLLFCAAGYAVVECPSLAIKTQYLAQALDWSAQDVWVFVSRNAVEHFAKQITGTQPANVKLVAVGAATAHAIEQQGWQDLQPLPHTFDSEGMLSLAVFQQLSGLRVGIVRGDGGRELLAQSLQEKGARITFYEVYKRIAAPFCNQAWLAFREFSTPIILFTSNSSVEVFIAQCPSSDSSWLRTQSLIVFSERIAQHARQLGFIGSISVTSQSSDQAILDCFEGVLKK